MIVIVINLLSLSLTNANTRPNSSLFRYHNKHQKTNVGEQENEVGERRQIRTGNRLAGECHFSIERVAQRLQQVDLRYIKQFSTSEIKSVQWTFSHFEPNDFSGSRSQAIGGFAVVPFVDGAFVAELVKSPSRPLINSSRSEIKTRLSLQSSSR